MSKITWRASMNVYSDDEKINVTNISVLSFQVQGGATRTIHLNATRELEVAMELDEARDHQNIQVFIAPTEGIAAVQLGEAFLLKKPLTASMSVESKIGKTWLRTFSITSTGALIERRPITVQRNEARAVKIELSLPDPTFSEQSPQGKGSVVNFL